MSAAPEILSWCRGGKCDPCQAQYFCVTETPFTFFCHSTDASFFERPQIINDTYGNYLVTIYTEFLGFIGRGVISTMYAYSTQPYGGQTETFGAPGYNAPPYIYGPSVQTLLDGDALFNHTSSAGGNIELYSPDALGQVSSTIVPIAYHDPAPAGHVTAIPGSIAGLGAVWQAPLGLKADQLADYVRAKLSGTPWP